jgi:hypothetical protein
MPRVTQCLFPRPDWDSPPPLPQANMSPPPRETKEGGGELCLLCGLEVLISKAKVAKVLGSNPASSTTVEYEGRLMKKYRIKNIKSRPKCLYKKIPTVHPPPFYKIVRKWSNLLEAVIFETTAKKV